MWQRNGRFNVSKGCDFMLKEKRYLLQEKFPTIYKSSPETIDIKNEPAKKVIRKQRMHTNECRRVRNEFFLATKQWCYHQTALEASQFNTIFFLLASLASSRSKFFINLKCESIMKYNVNYNGIPESGKFYHQCVIFLIVFIFHSRAFYCHFDRWLQTKSMHLLVQSVFHCRVFMSRKNIWKE